MREKLVEGDVLAIVEQLHQFEFGEHNILVYHDYDTLKDLYSHHCQKRLKEGNEVVVLLPHYETIRSVREALRELEIDTNRYEEDQTLIIMDAINTMFNPTSRDFLDYLKGLENRARVKKKAGICVIADMGSFYHLGKIEELVSYEAAIPPRRKNVKSSLLCIYHSKDFHRLNKENRDTVCASHFRELMLASQEQE